MRTVIGLGHYSRTGKDSLANFILDEYRSSGQVRSSMKVPFAWKLKEICHQLYGWAGLREPDFYDTPEGAPLRDVVVPALGKTPVEIWVAMGTPAVREQVYDRTWVDFVLKNFGHLDLLIIPDVRFINEIDAIRALRSDDCHTYLVKVVRPGVEPRKTVADQSIAGYDLWDACVVNDGTLEQLRDAAKEILKHLSL